MRALALLLLVACSCAHAPKPLCCCERTCLGPCPPGNRFACDVEADDAHQPRLPDCDDPGLTRTANLRDCDRGVP